MVDLNKEILIDIVYTYVDCKDKKWLKQKKKDCNLNLNLNSICRYNSDLDEIKYSVYSVEKYFKNQFRNIYFVTNNGKLPKCIKKKDNYIPILDSDLTGFRNYNSTVFEANLHKIKGLSEYYLYFNDDMILNKKLKISDYIDTKTNKLIWYKETNFFFNFSIKNPNLCSLMAQLFNNSDNGCIESRQRIYKMLNIKDKIDSQIGHNPRIFKKSMVKKLCKKFKAELDKNKYRITRSEDDFPISDIFCFYYLKKNKIIFTNKYKTKILIQFDNNLISKICNNFDNSSHFLCIEDVRKKKIIDNYVKQLLDKKFKKIKDIEII